MEHRTFSVWRLFLLLCFLLPWQGEAKEGYPALHPDSFYAEDYAGVLDPKDAARINAVGKALESRTKAQAAVVILPSVPDGDMETYSTGLFRERGFGDKQMNNGVMLLISMNDRKARIEVGYGLEGAINDAKAGRILDQYLLPAFQKGEYSRGILAAYEAIVQECMKEYQIDRLTPDAGGITAGNDSFSLSPLEMVLIGAGLVFLIAIDQIFLGGILTQMVMQILFLFLLRGGRGGGFGSSGRGGSSGGGGAGRGW